MGKIKWTEKAGGHLQAIHDFIARDSKTYATRFVTSLIHATEKLKKMPYCGRVVPEFEQDELREVIYHGYRIVYRVNRESEDVEVLAVIHGAREMKNIFGQKSDL